MVKNIKFQILTFLIPAAFSCIFLFTSHKAALILWILSCFAVIFLVPLFRKRENLWMFLCVALTGVPVNILFLFALSYVDFFLYYDAIIENLMLNILTYFVLFSIEEIVFGIITRFFFPRQYVINIQEV